MSSTHLTKAHLGAYVPREMYERLAEQAQANDRPLSAELRRAVRQYLEFQRLPQGAGS